MRTMKLQLTPQAARINAGLTMLEAAKKLNISLTKLSTYEIGRKPKENDDIEERMCLFYNLNKGDIFFG